MHENRETSDRWPRGAKQPGREKAKAATAAHERVEESDRAVVPVKPAEQSRSNSAAEVGEGRARTKENTRAIHTHPTQSGERVSQGLQGVRQAARERKQERFTALLHHVNVDLLRESFYASET